MIAVMVQDVGGWWSGVLQPFDGARLVLMLVVAMLAGIATTQGREPWIGPLAFVAGTVTGILGALAGLHVPFLDGTLFTALVVGVALLFVSPPRVSRVLPIAALLGGVVHGLSYRHGVTGDHGATYVAGFFFTTMLLQAFGAIVGSLAGRSVAARRTIAVCAAAAAIAVVTV
ncbi:MAG: HupE/UreJ family protein [Acidimicrobiales bacterium]